MTALLTELKIRARLQVNARRRDLAPLGQDTQQDPAPRLRDCLIQVARDVGFSHWDHARRVLGGLAGAGDDMGSFWHAPSCATLLNQWCATYDEAQRLQRAEPGGFVLPYRCQFMVVHDHFIRELALDPADPAWAESQRDLVQAYASRAWAALALRRLRAPRTTFSR